VPYLWPKKPSAEVCGAHYGRRGKHTANSEPADDLGRDDEFERSLYYYAIGTKDKREGVGAFLEKRSPRWD
jgi:enoyl-CoA hydratase/carnithine racemase